MNFREEYKNSIEIMSPSAEQLERMKKNILEQAKAPVKKAIPFKKIAYIGSAVAACAVISVAAINIVPRLSGSNANLTEAKTMDYVDGKTNLTADFADGAAGGAAFDDYDIGYNAITDTESETAMPATTKPVTDNELAEAADEADCIANDSQCDMAEDYEDACIADDIDSITDNTFAPSTTIATIVDEPEFSDDIPANEDICVPDTDIADEKSSFELDFGSTVLILDDVRYKLVDDGSEPTEDELTLSEIRVAPDGTEYRFDHYAYGYIVLQVNDGNGFELVGGYLLTE